MHLSDEDLRRFAVDGFVVVPGVVDEELLAAADAEIDAVAANEDAVPSPAEPHWRSWFLPPPRLPACDAALRSSPALALADELVAPRRLDHALDHIQVALTLPGWRHVPGGPHIDGHRPDGAAPASFTLLAAIVLTDQTAGASGNLWVWPGSHLAHQRLFRERGTRALMATGGHVTLLDPTFPLGRPREVLADRGDLVLAHFLLGHNKGGNTSDRTRRTIYYRLATPEHPSERDATFLDAFHEYPRVAALAR